MTEWTQGRINAFITATLRRGFGRFPSKWEVKKKAYLGRKVNPKTGRLAGVYECASCKGEFLSTDIEVDHKIPVINPDTGFTTWDEFINRLFCKASNLQVLCKTCHRAKSGKETVIRTAARRKRKE